MKARLLTTLAALLLALTSWAYDVEIDGIYYLLDSSTKTAKVTSSYPKPTSTAYTGSIAIPASVSYGGTTYSVTTIRGSAFDGCTGLTSISIPSSVTYIGDWAFSGCTGLASIKVEAGNIAYDSRENCNAIIETASNTLVAGCMNTTIPNSVTTIGHSAFRGCTGLASINIPSSVTRIGSYAFYRCTGLTSISIPSSVTRIEWDAFRGCTGLTSIDIPSSVTYIGGWAFSDCTGLASINIPSSVTSIEWYAFYGCTGLTSISIPASVTGIGDYAFSGCTGLASIKVEAGNTAYDSRENCNAIIKTASNMLVAGCMNTTIPNSVTGIGWGAFQGCTGLASIDIPSSVTYIVDGAFIECRGLTNITIPESVTWIGDSAFQGCTGLTSISIPSSVTSIEDFAFRGCAYLTDIYVYALRPNPAADYAFSGVPFSTCTLHVPIGSKETYAATAPWSNFKNIVETYGVEIDGIYYTLDSSTNTATVTYTGNTYTDTKAYKGNITIPASVSYGGTTYTVDSIGDNAFYRCTGLTSIDIPASVTTIGDGAFIECRGLTNITIPESVTTIGGSAFQDCTGLTSISIPSSVTSIEDLAFYRCTGLTNITIPESVTTIGGLAFYGCTGLTSITIPNSVTTIGGGAFQGCTDLASISIPSSVTTIGDFAFKNCTGLTSITIPSSATAIGDYAFSDCSGLASIKVEAGNTAYDSRENCNAIIKTASNTLVAGCMNTTIPNSVTSIGWWAFQGCTGLASIDIPSSVTNIGSSAFYECSGLKSISIPSSVTAIGNRAFRGCTGLTSISIPASVTSIGDYAFYHCTGLASISIPASVTTIGDFAFSGCTGLTNITIPASVTTIGDYAFEFCKGLTDIYALRTDPAAYNCLEYAFSFVPFSTCTLHVPIGSKETYAATAPWSNFKNIVETYGVEIDGIYYTLNNSDTTATVVYTGYSWQDNQTSTAYTGSITIPDSVTYGDKTYSVASIGMNAFRGCTGLKSISIPASITTIGDSAFYGCTGLKSIDIPASVTTIGDSAFYYCTDLTDIYALRTDPAAYNCSDYAFSGVPFSTCTLHVLIGSKETYAATAPWSNFKNIVEAYGVEIDGIYYTLNNSDSTATVVYTGYSWQDNQTSTAYTGSITIPDSVTYGDKTYTVASIGMNAFRGCTGLKSISIPASVTTIGDSAFYYCTDLTDIYALRTEPAAYNCSADAFYDVSAILHVPTGSKETYAATAPWSNFKNIVETYGVEIDGIYYTLNNSDSTATVVYTGYSWQDNQTSTAYTGSIAIPDSVTYGDKTYSVARIGMNAFRGCTGLKSISIPASVTTIGDSAFYYCTDLTDIYALRTDPAAYNCSASAFYDVSAILHVPTGSKETYAATAPWSNFKNIVETYGVEIDGIYYTLNNSDSTATVVYTGNTWQDNKTSTAYTGSITIPDSVTYGDKTYTVARIGAFAFRGCTGLKSISIPASVTTIGDSAFYYCTDLTDIYALRTDPAAYNCSADAFYDVSTTLPTLHVPIGSKETYAATAPWSNFKNIVETYGVEIDGIYYTLNNSDSTATVVYSGYSWQDNQTSTAYKGSITIPDSVTYGDKTYTVASIGMNAFRGCTGLKSISIPASVTTIGDSAFYYCTGLTDIYALRTYPAAYNCSASAFYDVSAILHVPTGSKETYAATAPWSNFKNIVETYGVEIDGIYYTLNNSDTTATVVYTGYSWQDNQTSTAYKGSINIPDSVTYGDKTYTVVSIGMNAFRGCTGLKSISIPASVTTIGDSAFYYCTDLTDIYALRTEPAAYNCSDYAFSGVPFSTCTLHVLIGSKETYAATAPWSNFKNIVETYGVEIDGIYYTLNNSDTTATVVYTGYSWQDNQTSTAYKGSINIPDSVTYGDKTYTVVSIGMNAFRGCTGLKSISIPASVTTIGDSAFYYCTGLTDIYALRTDPAAYNCSASAFYDVSAILHVPTGSKEAYAATAPWSNFKNIVETYGVEIDGIYYTLNNSDTTATVVYTGYSWQDNQTSTAYKGSINIPDSVTYGDKTYTVVSIGMNAFRGCTGLKSISIPASVTTIGDCAFYDCTALTDIYALRTDPAAYNCSASAFYDVSATLHVPTGSKETYAATAPWSNFKNIVETYGVEIDGIYYTLNNSDSTATVVYTGYSWQDNQTSTAYKGSITIPDSVTYGDKTYTVASIGMNAFRGCTGLKSISIPASVTTIGDSAFYYCTGLKKVVINGEFRYFFTFKEVFGDQVEELTLGKDVTKSMANFQGCDKLTSVTFHSDNIDPQVFGSQVKKFILGEGVTRIRYNAFYPGPPHVSSTDTTTFQPTALEEIHLPATLRTIDRYAFAYCVNLKRVHFQEGLDSIGQGAFTYCFKLENLKLPATLRSIGEGQGWLLACKDITVDEANPYLTLQDGVLFNKEKTILLQYPAAREGESYRIPDGVKTVMGYSFEGNSHLKELTIPASVDSMGNSWSSYTRLSEIRMESSVPPRSRASWLWTDDHRLSGTWLYPAYDFENSVTLYVPRGSKETYAATAPWSNFKNIVEYDASGIEPIGLTPSEADAASYYNLQGQRIAKPQRGQIVIQRNADGTSRKVLVK